MLDCRVATLHSTVGSHIYTHIPKPLTLTPNVSHKGSLTLAFTFRVHLSIYIKLSGLFDQTVPKKTRQFYNDPTSAVLNSPRPDSVVNYKLYVYILYVFKYIYVCMNIRMGGGKHALMAEDGPCLLERGMWLQHACVLGLLHDLHFSATQIIKR